MEGTGIPMNVALINQFIAWRATVRFEIVAARTRFHSTRFLAVAGFGVPLVGALTRSVAFSHVIDFSGENSKFDFDVDFNAQNEFLRIYEGEGAVDPVQNYSLGTMSFILQNALTAPTGVADNIDVLIFVRFVQPKVAVPRPYSPFTFNDYNKLKFSGILMTPTVEGTVNGLTGWSGTGLRSETGFLKAKATLSTAPPPNDTYAASGRVRIVERRSDGVYNTSTMVSVKSVTITATHYIVGTEEFYVTVVGDEAQSSMEFPTITIDPNTILSKIVSYDDDVTGDAFAESDVPPSQIDGTQAQDETVSAVPTTHEETPERHDAPCKIELGAKFEFLVSDVHEIGRRYQRMKLVDNEDLDQFVLSTYVGYSGETTLYLNFSVQVQSNLRALFAAWAGSIKYRIFETENHIGNVIFVPYLNTIGKVCVPVIDAFAGEDFTSSGVAVTTDSSIAPPMARERMYPLAGAQFIDVSCPFQTHFNFCYNSKTQDIAPISSGTLSVSVGDRLPEIYTAFGDDLRLGIYRPPQVTTLDFTGFDNGVAGFFSPSVGVAKSGHTTYKSVAGTPSKTNFFGRDFAKSNH